MVLYALVPRPSSLVSSFWFAGLLRTKTADGASSVQRPVIVCGPFAHPGAFAPGLWLAAAMTGPLLLVCGCVLRRCAAEERLAAGGEGGSSSPRARPWVTPRDAHCRAAACVCVCVRSCSYPAGMHLCGPLSPRAVEIFAALPAAVGIILSPCCLPSKKLSSVASDSGSTVPVDQYKHWSVTMSCVITPAVLQRAWCFDACWSSGNTNHRQP